MKTVEGWASEFDFVQLHFLHGDIQDSREYDTFRGKQAVLFINLLGKGLTQEISGDGGSIWWAPDLRGWNPWVVDVSTVRMEAQCCLFPYVTIKKRSIGSTSRSGFSLTIPGLIRIDFEPRQEKNREENLLEQRIEKRKQQQFNPPMARPRRQYLNPVYICGRRVLSPLRTPCLP